MGHQPNREMLAEELAEVRRLLDDWRQHVGRPNPIPEGIWDRAVELAARRGVGQIAAGLKLDHAKLKAKLAASKGRKMVMTAPQPANPKFVELFAGPTVSTKASTVGPCVLRVSSPKGVRVRLDLVSVGATELATLLKEFI